MNLSKPQSKPSVKKDEPSLQENNEAPFLANDEESRCCREIRECGLHNHVCLKTPRFLKVKPYVARATCWVGVLFSSEEEHMFTEVRQTQHIKRIVERTNLHSKSESALMRPIVQDVHNMHAIFELRALIRPQMSCYDGASPLDRV